MYSLVLCKIFFNITASFLKMESGHVCFVLKLSVNTAISIRSDCVGTNISEWGDMPVDQVTLQPFLLWVWLSVFYNCTPLRSWLTFATLWK